MEATLPYGTIDINPEVCYTGLYKCTFWMDNNQDVIASETFSVVPVGTEIAHTITVQTLCSGRKQHTEDPKVHVYIQVYNAPTYMYIYTCKYTQKS